MNIQPRSSRIAFAARRTFGCLGLVAAFFAFCLVGAYLMSLVPIPFTP